MDPSFYFTDHDDELSKPLRKGGNVVLSSVLSSLR